MLKAFLEELFRDQRPSMKCPCGARLRLPPLETWPAEGLEFNCPRCGERLTVREPNPGPPFAQRVSDTEPMAVTDRDYGSQDRRRIDWPRIVLFAVIAVLIFALASVFHK
jgi:predicted RNA-binding Zn-ribbon protein involved in translation (DUF1610 family)